MLHICSLSIAMQKNRAIQSGSSRRGVLAMFLFARLSSFTGPGLTFPSELLASCKLSGSFLDFKLSTVDGPTVQLLPSVLCRCRHVGRLTLLQNWDARGDDP